MNFILIKRLKIKESNKFLIFTDYLKICYYMFSFFQKKTLLTSIFPKDFVDIHSHFLPNIDDGSVSMDESVALLRRMHGYGIKNIICTPHVMESVWENTSETIQRQLDALNSHLKKYWIYGYYHKRYGRILAGCPFWPPAQNGYITYSQRYLYLDVFVVYELSLTPIRCGRLPLLLSSCLAWVC